MIYNRRLKLSLFAVIFAVLAAGTAQAGDRNRVPNLKPCRQNGYKKVFDAKGNPFNTRFDCMEFAALGGVFGFPSEVGVNSATENWFFITNLTDKDIQLNHIQYNFSSVGSYDITFGVPAQWPKWTLPHNLAVPNWKRDTTLELDFHGGLGNIVFWVLHMNEFSDMGFNVDGNDASLGWQIACGNPQLKCVGTDSVHWAIENR